MFPDEPDESDEPDEPTKPTEGEPVYPIEKPNEITSEEYLKKRGVFEDSGLGPTRLFAPIHAARCKQVRRRSSVKRL